MRTRTNGRLRRPSPHILRHIVLLVFPLIHLILLLPILYIAIPSSTSSVSSLTLHLPILATLQKDNNNLILYFAPNTDMLSSSRVLKTHQRTRGVWACSWTCHCRDTTRQPSIGLKEILCIIDHDLNQASAFSTFDILEFYIYLYIPGHPDFGKRGEPCSKLASIGRCVRALQQACLIGWCVHGVVQAVWTGKGELPLLPLIPTIRS